MIPDCERICMVAKTLVDKTLLFNSHIVLGCLYIHVSKLAEARVVFDLLRDVAEESQNWCLAMQAYEWIGRVLQASHLYELSVKAFKKMM